MLTNVVAPDKLGGLERYVRELTVALGQRNIEVVVVSKTAGDAVPGVEQLGRSLRLVRYRPPSKRNPLFGLLYPYVISRAVYRALRSSGAGVSAVRNGDVIVHGHFPIPMIPVLLARMPFIYTMHAPVYRELLGERQGTYALPGPLRAAAVRALALLERAIVRRASRVVTLSEFVAGEAQHLAGRRALPLRRIAGGIDLARFSPGPREPRDGAPVLFTARRLVERTGVEMLVEAMPSVLAQLPDARLYIAGSGPRREAIESLAERLDIDSSVSLLGRISDDELLGWYRSADICVTPTLYLEGFGLSTAEALACATPAVVTPAGANPELVRSVGPTLTADAVTPDALARAIVATARTDVDTMRIRSREAVDPAMGWAAVADHHERLYESLRSDLRSRVPSR